MKEFLRTYLILLIIFITVGLLLGGCTKASPTETIIDNNIGQVNQALDYAYNNIDQTQDVIFLENELEKCKIGFTDVKQSFYSEMARCDGDVRYWRLAAVTLFIMLCGAAFLAIKSWIKVI